MKKVFIAVMLCSVFAGAGFAGEVDVAATIFPVFGWVLEISQGADVKVALLLDKGVDLHSYQPTVDDMMKVAKCDVFVYMGGESDEWVKDALKNTVNKKQIAVNLLEVLGDAVKAEELVEGMEHEHHHHDHEAELDEHVWLSLRNAEKICSYLAGKFAEIDTQHKDLYADNLAKYLEKLHALDNAYEVAVNCSSRKTLLFADRFPFRYLVDDYALKYFAAFSGCSAESEASFHTIKFLAEKVNELNLPCVLAIEGSNHKIPQTVIASTQAKNQKELVLDSMQSVTLKDVQNSITYLSVMADNLKIITEALN